MVRCEQSAAVLERTDRNVVGPDLSCQRHDVLFILTDERTQDRKLFADRIDDAQVGERLTRDLAEAVAGEIRAPLVVVDVRGTAAVCALYGA